MLFALHNWPLADLELDAVNTQLRKATTNRTHIRDQRRPCHCQTSDGCSHLQTDELMELQLLDFLSRCQEEERERNEYWNNLFQSFKLSKASIMNMVRNAAFQANLSSTKIISPEE